jgi:hypothetical protein
MFGYDYALYNACSDKTFRSIHLALYEDSSMEFTKDGKPTARTYISFGQSKKYYAFKTALGVDDNEIIEKTNNDPSFLYKKSMSSEEMLLTLKIRASNPSLSETMRFQTDSKLHAASVYILQDDVILHSKGMMKANHQHKSLLDLSKSLRRSEKTDYKWLFSFGSFYESVNKIVNCYKVSSLGGIMNQRHVMNKLDIKTDALVESVSLYNAVQRKWFSIPDVPGNKSMHMTILNHYKTKHPWICDTHDETLEKSPFSNAMSLRNYIISISAKKKTIRTFAPSDVVTSQLDVVRSMIENCQWKGHRLNSKRSEKAVDSKFSIKIIIEKIWRALRAPEFNKSKADLVKDIILSNVDPFSNTEIMNSVYSMSKSERAMSMIIKSVKMQNQMSDSSLIPRLLESLRMGVVGCFIKKQKFDKMLHKYTGRGTFAGKMDGISVQLEIFNNTCTRATCRSEESLKACSDTMLNFIRSMNWEFPESTSRGKWWDFSKKSTKSFKSSRTCLIVDIREVVSLPRYDVDKLELEVTSYNSIRVIAKQNEGRSFTLISHIIRPKDLGYNDQHDFVGDDEDLISHWLCSKSVDHKVIEDKILNDRNFDSWAAECLRRRLLGMGKLPSVIDDFDDASSESTPSLGSTDARDFFMAQFDDDFCTDIFGEPDLSEDLDDEFDMDIDMFGMERISIHEQVDNVDFSWVDYKMLPVSVSASVDPAVTNYFFDLFIFEYSRILGPRFVQFISKKRPSLVQLVNAKLNVEKIFERDL